MLLHVHIVPIDSACQNVRILLHLLIPVVQAAVQSAFTLVQQVVVAHGDNIEAHAHHGIPQFHRRIEVEIGAGHLEAVAADQRFLIDDIQVTVD